MLSKDITDISVRLTGLKCIALSFSRAGSCPNAHQATLGEEQLFQSTETCRTNTFSSKSGEWLRIWFKHVDIPKGKKITVTLKHQNNKSNLEWKLPNDTDQNFDVHNDGDWFKIQESADVWFNLSYMSYSSSKYISMMILFEIFVNVMKC